jgi:hypothetical protein
MTSTAPRPPTSPRALTSIRLSSTGHDRRPSPHGPSVPECPETGTVVMGACRYGGPDDHPHGTAVRSRPSPPCGWPVVAGTVVPDPHATGDQPGRRTQRRQRERTWSVDLGSPDLPGTEGLFPHAWQTPAAPWRTTPQRSTPPISSKSQDPCPGLPLTGPTKAKARPIPIDSGPFG